MEKGAPPSENEEYAMGVMWYIPSQYRMDSGEDDLSVGKGSKRGYGRLVAAWCYLVAVSNGAWWEDCVSSGYPFASDMARIDG